MIQIYLRWVIAGRMAIDQVPERWRGEVQALLTPPEPPETT